MLGAVVAPYGERPIVVTDPVVHDLLGERLIAILSAAGLEPEVRLLTGEITAAATDAIAASTRGLGGAGVVVGVGGGKSLDAAKAVSLQLGLPVVTVPTIASNDSPTSSAIAIYDDDHRLVSVGAMPANPHTVLVDTELVANAPVRFLRAGIGDAVAKKFEAAACSAGTGVTTLGTRPLLIGSAIADACYTTIRQHGPAGLASCERGEVDASLEALVEAVVLLSGLGFENGGLSLAHSLTRGLMRARGAQHALHGEQVAWATLVQLVAVGTTPEKVADVRGFLADVLLPTSLADLGLVDATAAEVRAIARAAMGAPHLANLPQPVSEDDVVAAIDAVESGG